MEDWKLQSAGDHGLRGPDRARSLKRESGLIATAGHLVWWSLMRTYLKLYHRMRVIDAHHLPRKPPFVIIANHASHLDAMILGAPISNRIRDRVFPIAAGDVFFESDVLSMFSAGMLNALPIWRKKAGAQAMKMLRQRLIQEPCGFVLFPEGKRSRTGEMDSFKAGLGMLVAGTQVPVIPCYMSGSFHAFRPETRIPRPHPISLKVGPAMSFADLPDEREGWNETARRAETAVRALGGLPPMVKEEV